MKKLLVVLAVAVSGILVAQAPRIMLQTNSADYFAIEGKSGEKFYDQVKTINDFDIELYYEILNNRFW